MDHPTKRDPNSEIRTILNRGKALQLVKAGEEPFPLSTPVIPDSDLTLGQLIADENISYAEAMEVMFRLRKDGGYPECPDLPKPTTSKEKVEKAMGLEVSGKAPSKRKRSKQPPSSVEPPAKASKSVSPALNGSGKVSDASATEKPGAAEVAGSTVTVDMEDLQKKWDSIRASKGAVKAGPSNPEKPPTISKKVKNAGAEPAKNAGKGPATKSKLALEDGTTAKEPAGDASAKELPRVKVASRKAAGASIPAEGVGSKGPALDGGAKGPGPAKHSAGQPRAERAKRGPASSEGASAEAEVKRAKLDEVPSTSNPDECDIQTLSSGWCPGLTHGLL